jgi:hypothetical protein
MENVIISMKKGVLFLGFVVMALSLSSAGFEITGEVISENSNVGISSVLLKVTLTQGESLEKSFSVFSDKTDDFFLESIGIQGVSLSEDSISLSSGESKEIVAKFDSSELEPGIYIGKIQIGNGQTSKDLPVSFEVESEDIFFDANLEIPPAYSVISSGEKLVAQVKIYDLTESSETNYLGATSINVDYFIKSKDGEKISWETESVVIDETAEFSKTLSLPDEIVDGNYFFGVVIRYGSSVATASQMFTIEKETIDGRSFLEKDFKFFAILVFILIIFAGFIFMFIYIIRDRDKMVLELKKYNSLELNLQRTLLFEQKRILEGKGESKSTIKAEIKKKIGKLKKKQKGRVGELRKLKKIGSVSEMKRKLADWKNEGYDTKILEYKLKGLSAKEMQKIMNNWKRKGYKK